eukprot:TRINITY_DN967_c1_g1_i1.p1 TRINITY_DN967_c1_g1~~TRINITY_DN967_c1_g1_i1.p1  ORF type:complete len:656 (-),score=265.02 TRINITY_DN967_c1_g1_i1:54-2021(-)
MKKAAEKHRQKNAWLYEQEEKFKKQKEQLLLENGESIKMIEGPKSATSTSQLINFPTKDENGYNKIKLSEISNYTAKNSLMYIPDGAPLTAEEESIANAPREVNYNATRFTIEDKDKKNSNIKNSDHLNVTNYDPNNNNNDNSNISRNTNYSLLATPNLEPGIDASPIITWGRVDGTPLLLADSRELGLNSTPSNGKSFKIPETPKRDSIALKLADRMSLQRKPTTILSANSPLLNHTNFTSPNRNNILQKSPNLSNLLSKSELGDAKLRASYRNQSIELTSPQKSNNLISPIIKSKKVNNNPNSNSNNDTPNYLLHESNFIKGLVYYINSTFNSWSKNCLLCNSQLAFEAMRPTICDREFCGYLYSDLGQGFSCLEEMKQDNDVADLLVIISSCAVISDKRDKIFLPCPKYIKTPRFSLIENSETERLDFIKAAINSLPSIKQMTNCTSESDLKNFLNSKHELCYPVLKWLLSSNRAFIRRIPDSLKVSSLSCANQFLIISNTPEKERLFQEQKDEYGSYFAFHGSPIANWHSILRNGLKNMSNTALMAHGAAYGAGVYLGDNSGISGGYTSRHGVNAAQAIWPNSVFGANISCLAIVEVINNKSKIKPGPNMFIVQDENILNLRALLIFSNTIPTVAGADLKLPAVESIFNLL